MAVIIPVTDPFPLEPATWITGDDFSGCPAIPERSSIRSERKLFEVCPRSRLMKPESQAKTSADEEKLFCGMIIPVISLRDTAMIFKPWIFNHGSAAAHFKIFSKIYEDWNEFESFQFACRIILTDL
jgi:hypothetical protein